MRTFLAALTACCLLAVSSAQLDSQVVLNRYASAMTALKVPPASIFSYTVSQAGVNDIEQRHTIYRDGVSERDETIAVDGVAIKTKIVRISKRQDHYAVDRIAPRAANYTLLFLGAHKDGTHYDYEYEATPIGSPGGYVVDRVIIDGIHMLPRSVHFHTETASSSGTGDVEYTAVGGFWVPVAASVAATVDGKPARERIVWSEYRFPPSLPPATFSTPKPLPNESLPPI